MKKMIWDTRENDCFKIWCSTATTETEKTKIYPVLRTALYSMCEMTLKTRFFITYKYLPDMIEDGITSVLMEIPRTYNADICDNAYFLININIYHYYYKILIRQPSQPKNTIYQEQNLIREDDESNKNLFPDTQDTQDNEETFYIDCVIKKIVEIRSIYNSRKRKCDILSTQYLTYFIEFLTKYEILNLKAINEYIIINHNYSPFQVMYQSRKLFGIEGRYDMYGRLGNFKHPIPTDWEFDDFTPSENRTHIRRFRRKKQQQK